MPIGIPPGGFAGFAQMTPASKLALGGKLTRAKRKIKRVKRKVKRAVRRGKKLIKGSKAAKARMAKLRRMRK